MFHKIGVDRRRSELIGVNTKMRSRILRRRSMRWNNLIEVYVDKSSVSNNIEKESDANKFVHSLMMMNFEVDTKRMAASKTVGGIKSSTSLFWINFIGLQLEHQSPSVIKLIVAAAGIVKEIDPPDSTLRDATGYRARVEVDLYKPMRQGTMIETLYMGPTWIDFIYTGIPYHSCKRCHRFTHDTNKCDGAPPTIMELLRITGISPVVEPILFQDIATPEINRSAHIETVVKHVTAIDNVAKALIRNATEQTSKLPKPQMEGLVNNQFQNLRLSELSTEAVWDIIHSPMVSQLLHSKGLMIKSVGTEQDWIPSNQHLYGELQYDMRNNEFELYQNNQWAETVVAQMSIESQISQAETTKIPNAEPNPMNLLHISEDPSLLPIWEIGSGYGYVLRDDKGKLVVTGNKHKLLYRSGQESIVEDFSEPLVGVQKAPP
ncbi:hypothetical protein IFM89_034961 [Coptis chinensis]|uniref:DUF4283 domain-containing protein n=1 Tax=Coptis chinensis TaxID=261450 RepID=A0A835J3Q0_9MAGN|nr:hypothetical protein IFM89_034961 [Coptis chinensis]